MMHKHKWSKWDQEYREFRNEYETDECKIDKVDSVIYNVRRCSSCDMVEERKAGK